MSTDMRNDMFSREPSKFAVCEIAMHDKEICGRVGYSLRSCMSLYEADSNFRDECMKRYNWAEGFKRGD